MIKRGDLFFRTLYRCFNSVPKKKKSKKILKNHPFLLWNANICTESSEKKWGKKRTNEGKLWVQTAVDAACFVLESEGSIAVANSAAYCILVSETRENMF